MSQVALAWLLGTDGVTAPIVARARRAARGPARRVDVSLDAEERARLEAHAPPPPAYPQRFLREQNGIGDVASLAR